MSEMGPIRNHRAPTTRVFRSRRACILPMQELTVEDTHIWQDILKDQELFAGSLQVERER